MPLRLLLPLLAALQLARFACAPLSMDMEIDGVVADEAPLAAAAEPAGRSLGGRLRSMAEDLVPTAIIDKVAELRKPKDTNGEQTAMTDDGGARAASSLFSAQRCRLARG